MASTTASSTAAPAPAPTVQLEFDKDEDEEEEFFLRERYLDVSAVTAVTDAFKRNRKGYLGIVNFSLFCALYMTVIYLQRSQLVGLENRALRLPIQLMKVQSTVTTIPEFWDFFEKKFVPWAIQDSSWSHEVPPTLFNNFNRSRHLHGTLTQQYSNILGGIALLQTRSARKSCSTGSLFSVPPGTQTVSCWSEELSSEPFSLTSVLEDGKEVTMKVPYDHKAASYYTLLPSTASPEQLDGFIQFMRNANLVGSATRSLEVRVPVYNPSINVIGIFLWSLNIDLAGHITPDLTTCAIPYNLYPENWNFEVFLQVLLLYWLTQMIHGLWRGYLGTWPLPEWLAKRYPNAKQIQSVMPADPAGRTHIGIPAVMNLTIIAAAILWVVAIFEYKTFHTTTAFEAHSSLALFESKHESLASLIERNHEDVKSVIPLVDQIYFLRAVLDRYYSTASLTLLVMIFRMLHYLDFQGKLNAITVTVRTGVGELFHLLVVLNFVVMGFSFLGFLLFGSQVNAYLTFTSAFTNTWLSCFGLFGLKEAQLNYQDPIGGQIFQFLFKMVVTLLLLKMVIAIIFDAYKEAAINTRKTSPTVFADFQRLFFHAKNAIMGGDGYIPPDLVGKFMHHSSVRMFRTEEGLLMEREILREEELFPIFKKVMKKEWPELTDQRLFVKMEWLLEHYGRIRCETAGQGFISPTQIARVRAIFNCHDIDGSGTVSSSEFGGILKELNHPNADDLSFVQASLKVVDLDQSGEVEWEEMLMFAAFEMGLKVPKHLLAESMALMQQDITAAYIAFKEQVANDSAASIWDSSDTMGKAKDPSTAAQTERKGKVPRLMDLSINELSVSEVAKILQQRVEAQEKRLQAVKDMLT